MPWRYGIVKYRYEKNPEIRFYGIGELYYEEDPLLPHSCSSDPIEPYTDNEDNITEEEAKKDISWILNAMLKDCQKYPIFDIDGPYAQSPWDKE